MSSKPTFSSVIKSPGFRYLWLNQILVQLAYNTLNFALIVWVFKLVGTHLAVSGLMVAIYAPALIFGLLAGVMVDLLDRRKIIIVIDILLAFSFLLFIFIRHSYPLILLNAFFINSLAQFFMPAEGSSIPMLVSRKQFFIANSLFSLTLYASFMIGFSIGGPILNHFGINQLFYGGAILLGLAFVIAQNLPILHTHQGKKYQNRLSINNYRYILRLTQKEIGETFSFIRSRLNVAVAIGLMATVQGVIGILAVIMPSFLERVLLIHATDLSYFVIVPLGLGMITGALLVGRLFHGRPRRAVVIPAVILAGALFVAVGLAPTIAHLFQSTDLPLHLSRPRYFLKAPSLSTSLGIMAYFLGFCLVSIIIPCQTVIQEHTSGKNRGKIFSVLVVFTTGVSILPVVLVGGLSDLFGVVPILIGLGIVIFLAGLIALRPRWFFKEERLSFAWREFLGLGHWDDSDQVHLKTALKRN
ncbi:MAG: MFS transporter [Candidatus Omnitrophica bacterium]|nr:MFS transporter [Candidatus Omnitrophota bacterium]